MNNKRATKRALLTSVTALVMCVVMLAGTTFAWFTDTASTGVNKIQAGNLDVALEMNTGTKENPNWENAEGKTLQFKKAAGAPANEQVLWEPGCRYELPQLRVVNKGNLALKYMIKITGIKGDAKLNKAITWTITDSGDDSGSVVSPATDMAPAEYKLLNANEAHTLTIMGEMDKNAGNEYQGLSIDGISITVYATQMTAEFDSFNNEYDKDAQYPTDADALNKALAGGGTVVVGSDVKIAPKVADKTVQDLVPQMTVRKDTVLDLSSKEIGVAADDDFGRASPVLMAVDGATLTLNGEGTINCEAGNQQVYGINIVNGGKVVINGGKYYGAITAVQVQKGSLVINGGFFDMAPTCKEQVPQYAKYVVNCIDASFKDGTATISITGGTFVNFDPSANPEGTNTTYVAPGYKVESETKANGDIWYTVVPNTVSDQTELNNAINGATGAVGVQLPAGTYTLPSLENKDVTIIGTKDTVINLTNAVKKANSVTFDGVTVNFGTDNYKGFQHTSPVVYKDCTINGFMTTYGDTVFESCTFNSGNNQYSINFYGGKNFTLTNCHFYGVNKNVYIYQETLDSDKNVTFTDCDFHMSATSDLKSAVMLNAANDFASYKYNLVMNGCTQDGANTTAAENVAGNTNYQGLYGLKHVNGSGVNQIVKGTVTINGTSVYSN